MSRLTLAQAKPLLAKYAVQGSCESDPRVLEKINEARERLMTLPQNWKGKVQRFLFCSANSCITLPREILTLEAATVCNQPMKMRGPWYDMLEGGPGSGNLCGGDSVIDRGDGYVSFVDLDEPRNIKIYTDVPESSGARILLQGFDENGNRVRTFDSVTNAYVDGEYVALNNTTPQVSTTVFSTLDGIVKPETNGFIRLYAFTAGTPAVPASDTTSVANWPDGEPVTDSTTAEDATGDIPWSGSLVSAEWLTGPTENRDIIITFENDGSNVVVNNIAGFGGVPPDYGTVGGVVSFLGSTMTYTSYVDEGTFPNNFRIVLSNFPTLLPGQTCLIRLTRVVVHPADPTLVLENLSDTAVWTVGDESQSYVVQLTSDGSSWLDSVQTWLQDGSEVFRNPYDGSFTEYAPGSALGDLYIDWGFKLTNAGPEVGRVQIIVHNFPNPTLNGGAVAAFLIDRTVIDGSAAIPDYSALMAIYHPDETNPSYRRYEIPQLRASGSSCCGSGDSEEATPKQVVVMAKLRYLPVKRGTDFLVIEHLGALKMMLLALNMEEKGDLAAALQYESKAEEILAQEIQNHIGDAATANQGMKVQTDAWAASTIPNLL